MTDNIKKAYVDKKEFYDEMCKYVKLRKQEDIQARKEKISLPNGRHPYPTPPSDLIAKNIYNIANNFSYSYKFINYTYKDMMITEALWSCLRYCDRFNPKLSDNPFAYFTQITYHAFLKVINGEKKITNIKKKLLDAHFCEHVSTLNKRNLDNIIIGKEKDTEFKPVKIIKDGKTILLDTEDKWLCHTFDKLCDKYPDGIPKNITVDNEILKKMIEKHQNKK
jgi:hypothetical protein